MSNHLKRFVFAIWVLLIVSLSLVPLKLKMHIGTTGRWHNAGHFLMFFVATVLACRMVNTLYAKLLCCVGVAGVGFGMELVEKIAYRISYEWQDVRVDCLGVAFGLSLMLTLQAGDAYYRGVKRTA